MLTFLSLIIVKNKIIKWNNAKKTFADVISTKVLTRKISPVIQSHKGANVNGSGWNIKYLLLFK